MFGCRGRDEPPDVGGHLFGDSVQLGFRRSRERREARASMLSKLSNGIAGEGKRPP